MNAPTRKNALGFSAVEIVLVVLVVVVLGLLGWKFNEAYTNKDASETSQTTTQEEVPEVSSKEDVKKAEDYLSDVDLEGDLDTSELDAALTEA